MPTLRAGLPGPFTYSSKDTVKSKDYIPLIMGLCLLGGIILLAVSRPNRVIGVWNGYLVNFDIVFVGSYILWTLIELRVSRKDVNTEGKRTADLATCQLYGFGQALTFLTALWFASVWRIPNFAHFIGITLFLIGVCYRLWAIRTLGQFYSHRVRIASQHQIVASGPYRFTRHPAYAGMIVANTGIIIYFFNWVTVCVFALILVPAILLRIVIEERTLFGMPGYSEFARRRKRLFPAIWWRLKIMAGTPLQSGYDRSVCRAVADCTADTG
jgi:protein-S-isoprenylcysteine O-methyltransferase Ste14